MALLDAITDFLGIFEVIIVIMIIIEFFRLFKGGVGDGKLSGIGGLKVPNIFGKAAGSEAAESGRSQTQERDEEGREKEGEADLAEAEKLLDADIKEDEQIKTFLKWFESPESAKLTPEYAKKIAKEKGGALKNAVKKLLNYAAKAKKEVDAAYKQNYAALNTLGRELRERAVVDARAEREKLPRDQKDARAKAYDTALKAMQGKIQAYLNDIRHRGLQAAAGEKQIEQLLQQTASAEKAVVEEVNNMVSALSRGDAHGATAAATLAIRSLQAAEAGLKEATQFVAAARRQIAGIVGELYNTKKELRKELIEEHLEQAKSQQI